MICPNRKKTKQHKTVFKTIKCPSSQPLLLYCDVFEHLPKKGRKGSSRQTCSIRMYSIGCKKYQTRETQLSLSITRMFLIVQLNISGTSGWCRGWSRRNWLIVTFLLELILVVSVVFCYLLHVRATCVLPRVFFSIALWWLIWWCEDSPPSCSQERAVLLL